jgi:hypothetical protein
MEFDTTRIEKVLHRAGAGAIIYLLLTMQVAIAVLLILIGTGMEYYTEIRGEYEKRKAKTS